MSDPLHGVTLKALLETLVDRHGWDELARRVTIKCFQNEPSIRSSLKFLRKTPWARAKVEAIYVREAREAERKRARNQRRKARRAVAQATRAELSVPPLATDAVEPSLTIERLLAKRVHLAHGFLAERRCAELIAWSEAVGFAPAPGGEGGVLGERLLLEDRALAERWFARLGRAIPRGHDSYAIGLTERVCFARCGPGARLQHRPGGRSAANHRDFRRFALVVALSADFEGGQMRLGGKTISLPTGAALLFEHGLEPIEAAITAGTRFTVQADVVFRRGIRPGAL